MSSNPTINTTSLRSDIQEELSDLYTDGIISSAIYNVKNQDRPITHALIKADRHVCLNEGLTSHVSIFVPKGQRRVFFQRQRDYVDKYLDEFSSVKTSDAQHFALIAAEEEYLDVVSVVSPWAHAYEDIPVAAADPKETLENSLASETEDPKARKYQLTSGKIEYERPQEKQFYVEPASRKMVISTAFGGDRWVRFKAQIAPVEPNAIALSKAELDDYVIRAPYYCRQWLLMVAMQRLLSAKAAQAGGYFDLEQKAKQDANQNRPGTGNVILSGDELDGNYENDMNDF